GRGGGGGGSDLALELEHRANMVELQRWRKYSARPQSAPDLARRVDHEPQLGDLLGERHGVAADAAREAALRAERELLDGCEPARLLDAALELVLALDPAPLARHE